MSLRARWHKRMDEPIGARGLAALGLGLLALFGTIGFACGDDDDDPPGRDVSTGAWFSAEDPVTGKEYRCIGTGSVRGGIWCDPVIR